MVAEFDNRKVRPNGGVDLTNMLLLLLLFLMVGGCRHHGTSVSQRLQTSHGRLKITSDNTNSSSSTIDATETDRLII